MGLGGVSATATLVAMLSGFATIGSFLAYLYTVQRSNANAAREEALALAETRRQVIADLRRQNAKCEQRTRELELELQNVRAEARNQTYRVQRLFAIGLADLLADVRSDPRAFPPDVEEALQRIRQLLV